MKLNIAVVTGSRADYGILWPLLQLLAKDSDFSLSLYVTGMHLSPEFGATVEWIERDGFSVQERVEMLLASDTPASIGKSMGLGTIGFAQAFARWQPDVLVVLGDRFEVHAAVVAALPFTIAVAHIHGGEITEGAIDNALRDSITKMSHMHFVATDSYGQRLIQMGEEAWRVTVCGALSLDNLQEMNFLSRAELEARLGICLATPPLLVTFHPTTLEYKETEAQVRELLDALGQFHLPIVFTMANADTSGRLITQLMKKFAANALKARVVQDLGTQAYFSLMALAGAMVGNSSSGIIEAMSLQLPVVNIGTRQAGRLRSVNVIDVGYERAEIVAGIRKALAPETRAGLKGQPNMYGDGHAARRIVVALKTLARDCRLLRKRISLPDEEVARSL